jgi:hypothetical protein
MKGLLQIHKDRCHGLIQFLYFVVVINRERVREREREKHEQTHHHHQQNNPIECFRAKTKIEPKYSSGRKKEIEDDSTTKQHHPTPTWSNA